MKLRPANTSKLCELCQGDGCVCCDPEAMAKALGFEAIEMPKLEPQQIDDLDGNKMTSEIVATTVMTTKKGRTVKTPYTNQQAIVMLKRNKSDFARKLCTDYMSKGTLYGDQWAWAHILACEQAEREGLKTGNNVYKVHWQPMGSGLQLGKSLYEFMFANFELHSFGAKLTFGQYDWLVCFSMSKSPKNYGRVWISDKTEKTNSSKLYGTIGADGEVYVAPDCPERAVKLIKEACHDVESTIKRFSKATGICVMCRARLTEDSLERGYDLRCAELYGLSQ